MDVTLVRSPELFSATLHVLTGKVAVLNHIYGGGPANALILGSVLFSRPTGGSGGAMANVTLEVNGVGVQASIGRYKLDLSADQEDVTVPVFGVSRLNPGDRVSLMAEQLVGNALLNKFFAALVIAV